MTSPNGCQCAFCKNDRPFDIPPHLLEELLKYKVVVFAGAGISTENRDYAKDTFYDTIAHELNKKDNSSFPELMETYCNQPDGRIKLIKKLIGRLDYFISFSDFYRPMTRFHKSIAPLYMIKNIITTNWDDFFERTCGFDAFVNDSDMAFWEASERRLMKIHGSIRNLGSIVATKQDYKKSFRRLNDGPMGAQLKALLTQSTFIYTGYSLSDETYLRIARTIVRMTRPHTKHSYFIAPKIEQEKLKKFPIPLIPIETDGAYFSEQIRLHLESLLGLAPEEAFDTCEDMLAVIAEDHNRAADAFTDNRHPLLVFTLSYQDGLIHGLQRIRDRRRSGEYHCRDHVHYLVHGYIAKTKEYRQKRDFWNSCYAEGYADAMLYLLLVSDDPKAIGPPAYGYHGDVSFPSLSSVVRFPRKDIKKSYLLQANRIIDHFQRSTEQLIPDHTPYL